MSGLNRVSANLNMLFTHLPLLQRYGAAAEAGFKLVEVSIPYSESAQKLKEAADEHNLEHTLINAPPGNWDAGFRGIASLKSEVQNFRATVDTAIEYAKTLNCPRVHVMAGIPKDETDIKYAFETFVENLKYASEKLKSENLKCLIEPINQYSISGYFLNNYDLAMNVIEKVASENLKIQYDLFHAQQINGKLTATMKKLKNHIEYIQVAQVPHRRGCGSSGEIDYSFIFDEIKSINSEWIIGCEYIESSPEFNWIPQFKLTF